MRLNEAHSILTSVFLAWPKLLVNLNVKRAGRELTWEGARTMIGAGFSFDDLAAAESGREYSFQALDGSLFQLWYLYDEAGAVVEAATLGFLHSSPYNPTDTSGHVPWIRFDYAPALAAGPTHDVCHLHLSMSKEIRIPVSRIPNPAQFVELIACWFYPSTWCARRGTTPQAPWPDPKELDAVNASRLAHSLLSTGLEHFPHVFVP